MCMYDENVTIKPCMYDENVTIKKKQWFLRLVGEYGGLLLCEVNRTGKAMLFSQNQQPKRETN